MRNNRDNEVSNEWSMLDLLRVISGLLLLHAILSYWFTSSTMWGYTGKYIDSNYLIHRLKLSPMTVFTIDSLWDEVQNSDRLLLSINKTVYDVTASYATYNPKSITSTYGVFVGRDCTRMFVNGCFADLSQCTWDLTNIGYDESYVNKVVEQWEKFYEKHPKYWKVGYLDISNDNRNTPAQCLNGKKYPL